MDLSTSLVDLDSIELKPEDSNFNPETKKVEIEHLAHSIVKLQGLLTIPIVKRTGVESYQLISGYLEYYATLKAIELEPKLPDRLRVFIFDRDAIEIALEQLEAIQKVSNTIDSNSKQPNTTELQLNNITSMLGKLQTNLGEKISTNIEQSKLEIIKNIDSKIPKPLPPLEAFDRILEPTVYQMVIKKLAFLGNKKATKIADRLREEKEKNQTKKFKTFKEVQECLPKGTLSKEKMLDIIDRWN